MYHCMSRMPPSLLWVSICNSLPLANSGTQFLSACAPKRTTISRWYIDPRHMIWICPRIWQSLEFMFPRIAYSRETSSNIVLTRGFVVGIQGAWYFTEIPTDVHFWRKAVNICDLRPVERNSFIVHQRLGTLVTIHSQIKFKIFLVYKTRRWSLISGSPSLLELG